MTWTRFFAAAAFLFSVTTASAFPLDGAEQKCSANMLKSSIKVLGALGKEAARCHSAIGKAGGGGADEVASCVTLDEKAKISTSAAKVDGAIQKYCVGVPYPMTCPLPCETIDDLGATTDIDDSAELQDCLACFNDSIGGVGTGADPLLRGIHGAYLKDAAIPADKAVVKCQSSMIKGVNKLFQTQLKIASKCIDAELEAGALAAPDICTTNLATNSKVGAAIAKLATAAIKCSPPAPFDASSCSGLDGSVLSDCLDTIVACRACRWLNGMTGGLLDCDTFDNAAVDASCLAP
jgi:hypothetical protein